MKRLAAMAAYRISLYLKEYGNEEYWRGYPSLLAGEVSREELQKFEEGYWADLYSQAAGMMPVEEGVRPEDAATASGEALRILINLLRPKDDAAGRIAWICLELAMMYYMDARSGEIFQCLCRGTGGGPVLELAVRLAGGGEVLNCFGEAREAYERVELLLQAPYPPQGIFSAALAVDDRLIDWIGGENHFSLLKSPFLEYYRGEGDTEPVFREREIEAAAGGLLHYRDKFMEDAPVVAVSGEEQSGRRFAVKRIADRCGFSILFAEMPFLGDMDHVLAQWRKLLREVLLGPVLLCVTGIPADIDVKAYLRILPDEYGKTVRQAYRAGGAAPAARPLFITVDEGVKILPLIPQMVFPLDLKTPGMEERKRAWDYFAGCYLGGAALKSEELAVKMKLPIGKIKRIVQRLACAGDAADGVYDSRIVFQYCYELLDDGRYDTIKRVGTQCTFADLKLEERQKGILRDICAQVELRRQVMETWNLRSRYSYGTCVSALFTGPPGTGKTMAVHVLAGILGLELFKVDLSQIVDKYIGETEKRLEEVFTRAEQSNMILFFDEADAVIGKRSEVKEAKDKYANTEVSYLLQRIEEFDGIVILSSNYSQNIDAAFMRRIRFTVHFPLPDEATRKEIWQSAFPAETPQENVDFDYLAGQFEFSGGQIKNVVLNAAFFAASDGCPVGMRQLVKAIRLELAKDKKVSFQEALGEYAHLA